ncbi:hypothetical protein KIL84_023206 [Mauremys mutica]|uniref:Uncharacterized protein n=1 Tax=Mauremys mutica TaxID=74926 RepID=A0A9D3WR48_9SAUR|nr:hypothetical protein KIL84_023206 [Mauremys mutica]
MCVGKCTRILGPCLIALGVLSIAANVLLLFPSWTWSYVKEGHITKQAMQVPGVWGGGIIVLLAATQITAVGWRCGRSSDCGTCRNHQIQEMHRPFVKGRTLCKPGALDTTDSARATDRFEEQMNPESSDLDFPTLWFRLC